MMCLFVNKMEYVLTITRIIATIIVAIIVQLIHIRTKSDIRENTRDALKL